MMYKENTFCECDSDSPNVSPTYTIPQNSTPYTLTYYILVCYTYRYYTLQTVNFTPRLYDF